MVRHGFVAGLVAAIALAGASIAFTAASRARAQRAAAPAAAEVALPQPPLHTITEVLIDHPGPPPALGARRTAAVAAHHHAARPPTEVLSIRSGRTVSLRDRPGGRVIALLSDRSAFGSPTTLSVAARRGRWAGVPSPALRNGQLGWVDTGDGALRRTRVNVRLIVRLSSRRLELRIREHHRSENADRRQHAAVRPELEQIAHGERGDLVDLATEIRTAVEAMLTPRRSLLHPHAASPVPTR